MKKDVDEDGGGEDDNVLNSLFDFVYGEDVDEEEENGEFDEIISKSLCDGSWNE